MVGSLYTERAATGRGAMSAIVLALVSVVSAVRPLPASVVKSLAAELATRAAKG